MELTELEAEALIAGDDSYFWDGWELCRFVADSTASVSPDGVYRNGQWGYLRRAEISAEGTWTI